MSSLEELQWDYKGPLQSIDLNYRQSTVHLLVKTIPLSDTSTIHR